MTCEDCKEGYQLDGYEPDCLEGECLTGFDQLPDEALRLLELRGMLVTLGDLGLAERICREYAVTREDLAMLAWMEDELKSLRPKEKEHGGRRA